MGELGSEVCIMLAGEPKFAGCGGVSDGWSWFFVDHIWVTS